MKDIEVLKSVIPGWIAMKANTAIGLINAHFYQFSSFTSIAIHTEIAFILLILGILFACLERGLMMIVTSQSAGGIMARNLLPAVIVFSPVIFWLVLFGYRMEIYTAEFGLCILSILNMITFAVLIWRNARSLNIIDHQRRRSQVALKKTNEELETRVTHRTNELLTALEQLQQEIAERQITEQALFAEKELALVTLSWQASHDSLTGLVNRREFEHRLTQAVNNAQTGKEQHILCYLDLDQFKIVNDTCGHAAGDELLCEVAHLFQTYIRSCDTLARLGGDEFGIIFHNCSLEAAVLITNTIREKTQKFRFVWQQDKVFNLSISIGLVALNHDTPNMNRALSAADAACYVAKNQGRNRVHIYQADDLDLVRQYGEMQWVSKITQALEDNRFRLYYQSIVPVTNSNSETTHYEILLRLVDETGKLVLPMAFIPAAERYNLMQTIDRWVIHTFFTHLAQCVDFQKNHCPGFKNSRGCLYTINLSGASINDDQFIDFVCDQFTLHQIPPEVICFEITETVAIKNLGKAAGFIRALKEFGCCFALDDFGSGMSSFAYLKNLPVDYLKIDGSFVKHIVEEPIDLAMVDAINKIGQVMGIQTIAEFVENNEILKVIQNLGVNYAQGYGVARPVPFLLN
ncbi:EAL domain-containing protein [Nostoc sp. FACHB-190]|uniref:EAL domain-containing protein n=1 Tax=Nostoc sp. FACHB-190 TaxID=2692838 RepID=UPI001F54B2F5|nr:EAL domain-containing protein [Nostoc sp. FACHB-190]